MGRPIFYDTETTGIRAEFDRIVEIAAYDSVRKETFHKLVNPQMPIPAEASKVHHISDEMVADAPTIDAIIPEFEAFCEGDVYLVAHNNDAFDIHFLRHEWQRCDRSLPDWRYIDTLKWARKYRPDLPRHSLQYLREIYGFDANNAHRALDDVVMLHQIYEAMVDDLSPKQVFELLYKLEKITHMPFGKFKGSPLEEVPKDYLQWLANSGALDKQENSSLKTAITKLELLEPVNA